MINPDGTNLEPFVVRSGDQVLPEISSTFGYIAFLDNSSGIWEMRVVDLSNGSEFGFPVANNKRFDWAPDESGFFTSGHVVQGCGRDIDHISLSGVTTSVHSEPGRQAFWAVDAQTGKVYFTSDPCSSSKTRIRFFDPVAGQATQIQGSDGRVESAGDVSPNGELLAYSKGRSGSSMSRRIYGLDLQSLVEYPISSDVSSDDHKPAFSPDNRRVVFERPASSGAVDLYVASATGSNERVLLSDGSQNGEPEWAIVAPDCTFGPEQQPVVITRSAGPPDLLTLTWDSCGGSGVIEVESLGVTSANVLVNGEQVLGPSDFRRSVHTLEAGVLLVEGENELSVELRGRPGTELRITFDSD